MKGRILLCIYEFPVSTSLSIRWVNFVKYLSKKGWEITVLTNKPSKTYKPLKLKIPNLNIIYTNPGIFYRMSRDVFKPSSTSKKQNPLKTIARQFLRKISYSLIPDPTMEWVPSALNQIKNKHKEFDVIISANPPFSSHMIGYYLKKRFKKPWIADMTDPWSLSPQKDVPLWRRPLDEMIEKRIIKKSNKILFTTEECREIYLKSFPFLSKDQTDVVTCGFSEKLFKKQTKPKPQFTIVYTGVFFKDIRNPAEFFKALKSLNDLKIKVLIAGPISNEYIEYVKKESLSDTVEFLGHVKYERAISLQKNATVLLLVGNAGGLQIPGKIFEYIGARKPILAIKTDKNDIAADLIKKLNRGIVVENKAENIAESIRKFYNIYSENKLNRMFNLEYRKEYSWDSLGEELEKNIQTLLKGG